METLDRWIEQQRVRSASGLLQSVSPLGIVKCRPGFAQTIRPRIGSIVASPVLGAYDPEPDYFFHWYRDAAVVVDALRVLFEDGGDSRLLSHFADFVNFSRSLQELDGRRLADRSWRDSVAADFKQFLRTEEDLSQARGEALSGETRVNADGTLDISKWPRPQNDGPAMRAIILLRWQATAVFNDELAAAVDALLRADLRYTQSHWRDACFDIWEEEKGFHYYTLRAAASALESGAAWLDHREETSEAAVYRTDAAAISKLLDGYWREDKQYFKSRVLEANAPTNKELDIAVIFAAIHAGGDALWHSVRDSRMHETLARLEALFDTEYAINRDRAHGRGPAMGRYAGDVYYSGGAYYFSTLAAAEFCFSAAVHASSRMELIARGDAYLETVRAYTPANGDLSEQFDRRTGAQTSARQLAWSHAAFITCARARQLASAGLASKQSGLGNDRT
jgi:glucoamylase